jgi:hypothetical protein
MKKIIALTSVLFSILVPVQAHGADQKALVIIDSYFDSRVIGGNVSCITPKSTPCVDTVKTIVPLLSDNTNHGDAMVEVAKKQNPNIKIIALKSGATPQSDVDAGTFIDALTWVNSNSSLVAAVSFSRYFNGTSTCSPASVNTAAYGGVTGANAKIISLVQTLKSKGINIFAATGNKMGKPVDYPACLLDINSVSVGGINKNGVAVSVYQFDLNTDYFATLDVNAYNTTKFGMIANTTSAGNVAVAAQYASGNTLSKVVQVIS